MSDKGLKVLLSLAEGMPADFVDLLKRVFETEQRYETDGQRDLAQQRVKDLVSRYAADHSEDGTE